MKTRPFFAARIENKWNVAFNYILRQAGWSASVDAYTGYGTEQQLRVLARVILTPSRTQLFDAADEFLNRRGWRNFISAPAVHHQVTLVVNGEEINLTTDREGYIDIRIKNPGLEPGWQSVDFIVDDAQPVPAPIQIVSSEITFGIISDIDDTIISTLLPRPFIAAWNSFVLTERARQPVVGMSKLYKDLLAKYPGAPIIYISTGAWNTHQFLTRFMNRYGFPAGPLLLTDWGPTNTGWFRSGTDHKRTTLRELARDFPNISWVLVGDDGQHDPDLYSEFTSLQPSHVKIRAIRQLTFSESFLAHGLGDISQRDYEWTPETAPEVRGADGYELAARLRKII